ncbi:MAG: RrF2 family transcriptional regulator [Candidatus Eisenbacteria bacterium]|nr:RrF2 family transcriptional regulator [Candidatus Eisenbacteria bacterium]
MRLSTAAGRYGVRAMFDLALHYGDGPVPGKTISERQNITLPYLEQLMTSLRRSGLVRSVRGPHGGYVLARNPSTVKVGEIIRSLEGPIEITYCVGQTDRSNKCLNAEGCVSQILLRKLNVQLKAALDSTTLSDLCAEAGSGVCPTGGSAKRGVRRK